MAKAAEELAKERGGVITFHAPAELVASVEAAAALEGISKSDIVRRAVLRDLRRAEEARPS